MHCYICDKILSEKEIQLDPQTLKTEPCLECTEIIYEAAYVGKFANNEDDDALPLWSDLMLEDWDSINDWD